MFLNTLDVKLTPRTGKPTHNLEINQSTLEILKLILEFRLASACHIARFISGKDESKYIYRKLRLMWQTHLLESFKVFSGGLAGSTLFYMLSRKGLKLLLNEDYCTAMEAKAYPRAKTLLSWGLFKHEAQIVELASMECLNNAGKLTIEFTGEINSQLQDIRDDKTVEGLTPDYTVTYATENSKIKIYTEFERTRKSNEALLSKVDRYAGFSPKEEAKILLRLIFQTETMEQNFWINIITNRPSLLKIPILTTNLGLINDYKKFLEPIYSSESTVKLSRDVRLKADTALKIKLLDIA